VELILDLTDGRNQLQNPIQSPNPRCQR
jgi:hypothetical protein